jgi:hypothetical protein
MTTGMSKQVIVVGRSEVRSMTLARYGAILGAADAEASHVC